MLLAVDIGNTGIQVGIFQKERLCMSARLSTDTGRAGEEYALLLQGVCQLYGVDPRTIDGAILSSVVPPLTRLLCSAIALLTPVPIMVVGPGIKTGFRIRIDNPAQLGSDLVAAVAGALESRCGPLVVIDMSTAITFTAVSGLGEVLGVSIAPGPHISLEALSAGTAQLPYIPLEDACRSIGTNTVDSMKSGIVFGTAALVDGMIDRFAAEMGETPTVVATGAEAGTILSHCVHPVEYCPDLLLQGLCALYRRNQQRPL